MTINTIKEEWAMEFNLSLWVDKIGEKERKVLDIPKAKDSPIGVSTPTLVKNINGLQDLTFTIPRWYIDNGERVMNPLLSELTEEKKVKLQTKVGEKVQWYDFVIKGITEQKEGMTNQYSCKELATLELSKRGVDTLLNTELENNYGTISELGNRILANSGYSVATDGDIPYATTDEVLYQMKVTTEFTAQNTLTGESQSINTGDYIYLPYKSMDWVNNSWVLKSTYDTKGYQFIWNNGKAIKNDDLREGRVFTDIEQKWNFSATNKPEGAIILAGSVSDTTGISGAIKGRFLVESTQRTYEPIMDRFVEKVEVLNEEAGVSQGSLAYKYKETKYLTSALVKNLLVNTQNFISTDQWTSSSEIKAKTMIKPVMTNALSLDKKGGLFINSGFMRNNVQFTKGEKYVVALKARFSDPTKDTYDSTNTGLSSTPTITVGFTKGSSLAPNSSQLSWTKVQSGDEIGLPIQGTHPTTLSVGSSISYNNYSYTIIEAPETSKTLGFGLSIPSHNKLGLHIEDIQVFKYVLFDGKVVLQNDAPQGIAIEETKYYALNQGQEKPLVSNDAYYRTLYRKNYESVRHLDVQRNSYYNNIVALADKFEMWAEFGFNRNEDTGEILGRYVKFHRFNPNDTLNFAGFKNGINIKDINRTVNTEEITTRLIVEPSSNQFGVNGITTIARAKSNATRETSIYNFDYYINNNLLDKDQLSSDLYGTKADDLAYLTKVKKINEELFPLTEKIVALLGELEAKKSDLVVQEELLESANREKDRLEQLIADYEKSLEDLGGTGNNNYGMSSALQNAKKSLNKTLATISSATKQQAKLSGNVTSLSSQLYGYEGKFKGLYDEVDESILLTDDLVNKDGELLRVDTDSNLTQASSSEKGNIEVRRLFLLSEKKRLHKLFEQKYNRFLTEGVWSDGNHIDDNIYYAEAQIISAINAFPKVEYEIPVADISGFEGYEGYHFNVGEATIIEDEEFFGFSEQELFGQIVRTPYKKSVIIMETREVLDDPSQSTVVVKTYKGNHRDLVTQITTSLNSLERELGNQAVQISKTHELSSNFADNRLIYEQIQSDVNAKVEEYQSQLAAEIAAAPGVTLDWLNKNTGVLDGNVLALESVKTGHLEAGVISAIKADIQLLVANTLKADKAFIEELQSQFAAIELINTGRIESADGSSWWDLGTGEINLAGDNVNVKIDEEGVRTVVTSELETKGKYRNTLIGSDNFNGYSLQIEKNYVTHENGSIEFKIPTSESSDTVFFDLLLDRLDYNNGGQATLFINHMFATNISNVVLELRDGEGGSSAGALEYRTGTKVYEFMLTSKPKYLRITLTRNSNSQLASLILQKESAALVSGSVPNLNWEMTYINDGTTQYNFLKDEFSISLKNGLEQLSIEANSANNTITSTVESLASSIQESNDSLSSLSGDFEAFKSSQTQSANQITTDFKALSASVSANGEQIEQLLGRIVMGGDSDSGGYTEWRTGDGSPNYVRVSAKEGVSIYSENSPVMTFANGSINATSLYVQNEVGLGFHTVQRYSVSEGGYTIFNWNEQE